MPEDDAALARRNKLLVWVRMASVAPANAVQTELPTLMCTICCDEELTKEQLGRLSCCSKEMCDDCYERTAERCPFCRVDQPQLNK